VIEVYPKGFPTRYQGKRRAAVLQLRAAAKENGVGTLYDKSLETIRKYFGGRQTTIDRLAFLNSARKRVFYLLPKESSSGNGLHYAVYTERLAEHLGVSVRQAKEILPAYRSLDEARQGNGEFGGGYFKDESQILQLKRELDDIRQNCLPG